VTLSIDEVDPKPRDGPAGIVKVTVTVVNHGKAPIKVSYPTFSLVGRAGETYPALLPSELGRKEGSSNVSFEGIVGSANSKTAVVYFRSPAANARPIDLRVDLADSDDRPLSRTFVPLPIK
jgi:hypothetical protein